MVFRSLFVCFLLFQTSLWSQKKCDFTENITDSLGTLRTTKEILMYERVFGNNENFLFFSLSNSNGVPFLTLQNIQKNNEFIKALCIDPNSKIYIKLENGKIITLLHTETENCGNFFRNDERNVRIVTANFLFLKNTIEEIQNSPIELIRIKYSTETKDYMIKKELDSEILKTFSRPSNFFMDYLHCVVDN